MFLSLIPIAIATLTLAPAMIAARLSDLRARARTEHDLAARALAILGIVDRPLSIERLGGGRSNAVFKLSFSERTLVLKQALSAGTLLAFAARWVGPQPYSTVSARARIAREAHALSALSAAGVRVPRVIAANAEAGLLLTEFVEGEPLPTTLHLPRAASRIRAYAAALRAAHGAGFALVDAHPGNALVTRDGTLTLIDLEFAEPAPALGAQFRACCQFDIAYAAQYFTPDERGMFLAAIGLEARRIDHVTMRLAPYAQLFARERRHQRATGELVERDVELIPAHLRETV
jgi:hypothetical protein